MNPKCNPGTDTPVPLSGAAAVLKDLQEGAEPMTLRQACRHPLLRTEGRDAHLSKIHRLVTAGIRDVRLECARLSGGMVTTGPAIERFVLRLNGQDLPAGAPSPSQLQKRHDQAISHLAAAGI